MNLHNASTVESTSSVPTNGVDVGEGVTSTEIEGGVESGVGCCNGGNLTVVNEPVISIVNYNHIKCFQYNQRKVHTISPKRNKLSRKNRNFPNDRHLKEHNCR